MQISTADFTAADISQQHRQQSGSGGTNTAEGPVAAAWAVEGAVATRLELPLKPGVRLHEARPRQQQEGGPGADGVGASLASPLLQRFHDLRPALLLFLQRLQRIVVTYASAAAPHSEWRVTGYPALEGTTTAGSGHCLEARLQGGGGGLSLTMTRRQLSEHVVELRISRGQAGSAVPPLLAEPGSLAVQSSELWLLVR
ncbi:hypothetical protein HaLaN_26938 [Haematococcus lacustris]|uniref:Uncharacterized protein n=1 Tax=Haematococcus lacustris TaxID=44745 RepID=A0A6A0A8G4_HAELA|nr:hypothetical protein HaLaN_26938 [Haematococcus lacustris]